MVRYEIRRSNSTWQPYYFRAVSVSNNAVLATSETYVSKADAMRAVNILRGYSSGASVVDLTS